MRKLVNRQLVFIKRPSDAVGPEHFVMRRSPAPEPGDGEALVRVHWLGIDATQRTWLNEEATYISPAKLGAVMPGSGVGQVVASRSERLTEGDWVAGLVGWQDYVIAKDEGLFGLNKVPEGVDPKAMLSIFGVNGLTAYFGVTDVGRARKGDTVFVTGAVGSVGSIAGQIARLSGCRVVGSAGGPDKCAWARDVALFDDCIDYKSEDVGARLATLAPGGVDIVFDNVGGTALEAALDHIALHARVVLCGSISSGYRNAAYGDTPRNYMQLAFKRARMEGFIFLDYVADFPKAFAALSKWVAAGDIRYQETIATSLEAAPEALAGLFKGRNLGKQLVQIA